MFSIVAPKRDYLPFMSSKLRLNVDNVLLGVVACCMFLLITIDLLKNLFREILCCVVIALTLHVTNVNV